MKKPLTYIKKKEEKYCYQVLDSKTLLQEDYSKKKPAPT